jgi:hypothetical protein
MPSTVDRILRNALAQLQTEREKIDRRIGAFQSALSGRGDESNEFAATGRSPWSQENEQGCAEGYSAEG